MRFLYIFSFLACISLLASCSDSDAIDNNEEQSSQQAISDMVGVWVYYSGTPVSILTEAKQNIYNVVLELTANGNIRETLTTKKKAEAAKEKVSYGNWMIKNDKIIVTNWNGDTLVSNISYQTSKNGTLKLIIDGSAISFLNPEVIRSQYPELITGIWINDLNTSGKIRAHFNKDGSGFYQTNYYDNKFFGQDDFVWSVKGDTLTIRHTWIAGPTGISNLKINYINKEHLSYKNGNDVIHLSRE